MMMTLINSTDSTATDAQTVIGGDELIMLPGPGKKLTRYSRDGVYQHRVPDFTLSGVTSFPRTDVPPECEEYVVAPIVDVPDAMAALIEKLMNGENGSIVAYWGEAGFGYPNNMFVEYTPGTRGHPTNYVLYCTGEDLQLAMSIVCRAYAVQLKKCETITILAFYYEAETKNPIAVYYYFNLMAFLGHLNDVEVMKTATADDYFIRDVVGARDPDEVLTEPIDESLSITEFLLLYYLARPVEKKPKFVWSDCPLGMNANASNDADTHVDVPVNTRKAPYEFAPRVDVSAEPSKQRRNHFMLFDCPNPEISGYCAAYAIIDTNHLAKEFKRAFEEMIEGKWWGISFEGLDDHFHIYGYDRGYPTKYVIKCRGEMIRAVQELVLHLWSIQSNGKTITIDVYGRARPLRYHFNLEKFMNDRRIGDRSRRDVCRRDPGAYFIPDYYPDDWPMFNWREIDPVFWNKRYSDEPDVLTGDYQMVFSQGAFDRLPEIERVSKSGIRFSSKLPERCGKYVVVMDDSMDDAMDDEFSRMFNEMVYGRWAGIEWHSDDEIICIVRKSDCPTEFVIECGPDDLSQAKGTVLNSYDLQLDVRKTITIKMIADESSTPTYYNFNLLKFMADCGSGIIVEDQIIPDPDQYFIENSCWDGKPFQYDLVNESV